MTKLVSERLPNDGGYHVKRLVSEANERLKQIGKQGKRATIVAKKSSLSLQFTLKDGKGRPQKNVGLGAIPLGLRGILEAENIARLVTAQLVAGTFEWDWFYKTIGKPTSEQAKQLTCREMVEQYKKHYLKQSKDNKAIKAGWYVRHRNIESLLGNLDEPISLSLVRQITECTQNNSISRKDTLNGLAGFLKYFGNTDYKQVIKDCKDNNNPKPKKRKVPSDRKITEVYEKGFCPNPNSPKKWLYRYQQWQFFYSLLAIYGLRIHEAWNIANWDKPVTLKNDDWVTVDIDNETEVSVQREAGNLFIPAILDPDNKEHILCIKHDTKTGYRMAMPMSPEGHNWIEEFNLLQPLNLPDIPNPLSRGKKEEGGFNCTSHACKWFRRREYSFTPHDLRHAYNHRGHRLGVNVDALCQSLGHGIQMNTTTYTTSKSDPVKLQDMFLAISKEQIKRSRTEELEAENKALKTQLKAAQKEIELL